MIVGSIARRYAKALLEIGVAQNNLDALAKEIERAGETYRGSKDLATVLENPSFAVEKRRAVLSEIIGRLALSKIARNFLMLLLDRGRIAAVPDIARELRLLADQHGNRVRAIVTSAKPLDPGTELRLKTAFEKRTGKSVIVEKREDPALIGGIVTQIGDVVYDGSVRTQLDNLKHQLLSE